jgi:A/G-specific adenine glycosylase
LHGRDKDLGSVLHGQEARIERIRTAGLAWYERHRRRFAFRGTHDPYRVLVSEIVLQQTQVARGEPAWMAFVARFPTFEALAAASPGDVIRAWAGLGYNGRALRLQAAARMVVAEHGGRLPDDLDALLALPGIGPYTARALLAICFGRPTAAVDTNVRRVVSRFEAGRPLSAAETQAIADRLVPANRPADWTAALMDVGALICRPRQPRCDVCPFRAECRFADPKRRPVSRPVTRRGVREGQQPYEATRRWLRGRIVADLRAAPAGVWLAFDGPLGRHGAEQVAAALAGLADEGLVERDSAGRARLPA